MRTGKWFERLKWIQKIYIKTLIVHTRYKVPLLKSDALRVASLWKACLNFNKKDKLYGARVRAKQTDCCVSSSIQHKRDRVQEPSHCHSTFALNLCIPNIYTRWSLGLRALLELQHIFYNVLTFCNAQQTQRTEDVWMRVKMNNQKFELWAAFCLYAPFCFPWLMGKNSDFLGQSDFGFCPATLFVFAVFLFIGFSCVLLSGYLSLILLFMLDCNHIER